LPAKWALKIGILFQNDRGIGPTRILAAFGSIDGGGTGVQPTTTIKPMPINTATRPTIHQVADPCNLDCCLSERWIDDMDAPLMRSCSFRQ
jgi:hypothetical protein